MFIKSVIRELWEFISQLKASPVAKSLRTPVVKQQVCNFNECEDSDECLDLNLCAAL